jgi:ribonucleotide reductase alpha subunit
LGQSDAEFLREELLRAAREADATEGDADRHGERYILDFELALQNRRAVVRSAWIIRRGEGFPRLTSCFVLSK